MAAAPPVSPPRRLGLTHIFGVGGMSSVTSEIETDDMSVCVVCTIYTAADVKQTPVIRSRPRFLFVVRDFLFCL